MCLLQTAQAFKALSHPNRLKVYREILAREEQGLDTEKGCPLADLLADLKIGAPTLSHHIKELVNADLIFVRKQGKFVTCYANPATRSALIDFLQR